MITLYVIVRTARQVDKTAADTLVAVDIVKAFKSKERATKEAEKYAKQTTEMINTADGPFEFFVETGVHPVEVEDLI
jgi:hypothetical protein